MKKILIISQGGVITSHRSTHSDHSDFEGFQTFAASRISDNKFSYDLVSIGNDLTGVNSCSPHHCNLLAETIERHYHEYDGFFILRGAAYSDYVGASLTFSLQGNYKPILIGDGQGSFLSPISDAASFLNRGLLYLVTEAQSGNKCSDVSILSDGLIVNAVDAALFPDGTMRYYSRTGENYRIENLSYARDDGTGRQWGMFKRVPIDETLIVHSHDGIGTFGKQFSMVARIPYDALLLTTTQHGGFSALSDNGFEYLHEMGKRATPVILVNNLVHGGVINTSLAGMGDHIVEGLTMSKAVAAAKALYALGAANGSVEEFKNIMHFNFAGEIPPLDKLIGSKRPEFNPRERNSRAVI